MEITDITKDFKITFCPLITFLISLTYSMISIKKNTTIDSKIKTTFHWTNTKTKSLLANIDHANEFVFTPFQRKREYIVNRKICKLDSRLNQTKIFGIF